MGDRERLSDRDNKRDIYTDTDIDRESPKSVSTLLLHTDTAPFCDAVR